MGTALLVYANRRLGTAIIGLDGIELIMAVEETFGIEIADEDAQEILTVGQLWDYVCARVAFVPTKSCVTAKAFYRLRRALIATTQVWRRGIRPDSLLEPFFPTRTRRDSWKLFGESLKLKLPELEYAPRLRELPMSLALLATATAGAYVFWTFDVSWWATILMIVGLAVGFCVANAAFERVFRPLRIHFNPAWETAGGLARTIVGLNEQAWLGDDLRSREIAWEKIRALVAQHLDVSLHLVTPDAGFVNDLGLS